MWMVIIRFIEQMRILDEWELYHFNIRGPIIVGVVLSAITSLVYIFLNVAWLGTFTQTFCRTYCYMFKISDLIQKSGVYLDVALAPPPIKNMMVHYDGLLEHWNFCLKHFWIWPIVWVLSMCKLYVPHSVYLVKFRFKFDIFLLAISISGYKIRRAAAVYRSAVVGHPHANWCSRDLVGESCQFWGIPAPWRLSRFGSFDYVKENTTKNSYKKWILERQLNYSEPLHRYAHAETQMNIQNWK